MSQPPQPPSDRQDEGMPHEPRPEEDRPTQAGPSRPAYPQGPPSPQRPPYPQGPYQQGPSPQGPYQQRQAGPPYQQGPPGWPPPPPQGPGQPGQPPPGWRPAPPPWQQSPEAGWQQPPPGQHWQQVQQPPPGWPPGPPPQWGAPPPPRRRNGLLVTGLVLLALLLVGGGVAAWLLLRDSGSGSTASDTGLDAVRSYSIDSPQETVETVTYAQTPPVGGDYDPAWHACGTFTRQLRNENVVHTLERGAVWITYQPGLSSDQLSTLADALPDKGILSPYPGQPAPVVVTAWETQLYLSGPDDPRLAEFMDRYGDGHTAPDDLATCDGGVTRFSP